MFGLCFLVFVLLDDNVHVKRPLNSVAVVESYLKRFCSFFRVPTILYDVIDLH